MLPSIKATKGATPPRLRITLLNLLVETQLLIHWPIDSEQAQRNWFIRQQKPNSRSNWHWQAPSIVDNFELLLDCPQNHRYFRASFWGKFKCLGTDPTKMAISAGTIVEHLDVVKYIWPGEIPGFVNTFSDALLFQATKEWFSKCSLIIIFRKAGPKMLCKWLVKAY